MKWLLLAVWFLQVPVSVSITPDSGRSGAVFEMSGSGFASGERVKITWDGSNLGGTVGVEADGTFTYRGVVPADAQPGTHLVEARGRGGVLAGVEFTVVVPSTTTSSTVSITTTSAARTTASTMAQSTTTSPSVPPTSTASSSTPPPSPTVGATSDVSPSVTPAGTDSPTSGPSPGSESMTPQGDESDGEAIGITTVVLWIVAVAGGIWLVAWRRPSEERDSVAEDVGVETPAAVTPVEVEDRHGPWNRRPLELRPQGRIDELLGTPDAWLAVGSTTDGGRVAIWRSVDAVAWESAAVLDEGRVRVCIPWNDGTLLLGSVESEHGPVPSSWVGDAHGAWTRATDHDPTRVGVVFEGAVAWDRVVVAHGRGPGGPGIWTSRDGGSWTDVPLPADIDVLVPTSNGILAIGRWIEDRRPVVARSTDGARWVEAATDPFVFDGASVASLVSFEGGLVAGGRDLMRDTAALWVSDDGSGWIRVPFAAGPGTAIERLSVVAGRLVAIGSDRGPRRPRTGEIAVWESRDAVSWEREDGSTIFTGSTGGCVAESGDAILVVGHLAGGPAEATDQVPATWVRVPALVEAVPSN